MSELLDLAKVWPEFLVTVSLFGFAPGFCLRLIVLVYPREHPRRRELVAELYELPYVKRPIWVVSQLETALFEGVPARFSELWRRLRRTTKPKPEREPEPEPAASAAGTSARWQVGLSFGSRSELAASGIHRALQAGIVGTPRLGAESVVVNDEFDHCFDDCIVFTGHGGRDIWGRQVADQSFEAPGNAALRTSWLSKRSVRVIRRGGFEEAEKPGAKPGYHYDGDYLVVGAWTETASSGSKVCRFVLMRCESLRDGQRSSAA
jgi:hypothetical protein